MRQSLVGLFLTLLIAILPRLASSESCGGEYACGEALVKFSRHADGEDIQRILREAQADIVAYFPQTRIYHLAFRSPASTLAQIEALKKRKGVLVAAPNGRIVAQVLPDDADFALLWGLKNTGHAGADIGIEDVWTTTQDGSGVLVAVLDTGVDYEHPDLASNIWVNPGEIAGNGVDDDGNGYVDDVHGYDFVNDDGDPMDDHQHGTHVTGILGAVGNNANGVTGVVWNVKIMALKVLDDHASGNASEAIPAVEYALANGAKILNNSWGGGSFNAGLLNAILNADAQGALFFAAAGNQGRNTDVSAFYPAGYDVPNILALASIDENDTLSGFSNFGATSVDLAAPGGAVYSTKPGGNYGYISGTSMATPYASGTAALLWTQHPELNHRQIRNLLFQGVAHRDYLEGKTATAGLLNVGNSAAIAADPTNQPPAGNAGSDQNLPLGVVVALHGSATDPDGDFPLIFEWELAVPAGSQSRLDDAVTQNPTFIPDREGVYTATLTVSDSLAAGTPDGVTVTIAGGSLPLPTVVIGGSFRLDGGISELLTDGKPVPLGADVFLDGRNSSSLFPEELLFAWTFVAKPEGSQAEPTDLNKAIIQFHPDLAGTYTFRLAVEDAYNENFGEISFLSAEIPAVPPPPPPSAGQPLEPAPETPAAGAGCSLSVRD